LEDLVRVPPLRSALPLARGYMLGHAFDERVKRLDVRDVLPAQAGEAGPDVFVEPHAVRREPVPQLPREAPAADVPVREDIASRWPLAIDSHSPKIVEPSLTKRTWPRIPRARRARRSYSLDDDRHIAVLLREVLDRLLEVFV